MNSRYGALAALDPSGSESHHPHLLLPQRHRDNVSRSLPYHHSSSLASSQDDLAYLGGAAPPPPATNYGVSFAPLHIRSDHANSAGSGMSYHHHHGTQGSSASMYGVPPPLIPPPPSHPMHGMDNGSSASYLPPRYRPISQRNSFLGSTGASTLPPPPPLTSVASNVGDYGLLSSPEGRMDDSMNMVGGGGMSLSSRSYDDSILLQSYPSHMHHASLLHQATPPPRSRQHAANSGDNQSSSNDASSHSLPHPHHHHPHMFGGMSEKQPKERSPSATSFPVKLHKILSEPQYREYIAWLPHGRAWRVLKPKAFEEQVIPKYFRSEKYASFMRQVNGWGFIRITEGPDLNAYYHEMFLRGLPDVAAKMRRPQRGHQNQVKELGECPDFYKISMLAPLPDPDAEALLPSRHASMSIKEEATRGSDAHEANPVEGTTPNASSSGSRANSPSSLSSISESGTASKHGSRVPSPVLESKEPNSPIPLGTPPHHDQHLNHGSMPSQQHHQRNLHLSHHTRMQSPPLSRTPSFGETGSQTGTLGSWAEHEHDQFWGSAAPFSPQDYGHNFRMGQVTPPDHQKMSSRAGYHGYAPGTSRGMSEPGSLGSSALGYSLQDSSGLSVADLCYLTQQNRVLMQQAHARQKERSVTD